MTPQELLLEAADAVEEPGKWTQRFSGRKADGIGVRADHPEAVCWCAFGHLIKLVYGCDVPIIAVGPSLDLFKAKHGMDITEANDADGQTPQGIAQMMREAASA